MERAGFGTELLLDSRLSLSLMETGYLGFKKTKERVSQGCRDAAPQVGGRGLQQQGLIVSWCRRRGTRSQGGCRVGPASLLASVAPALLAITGLMPASLQTFPLSSLGLVSCVSLYQTFLSFPVIDANQWI